MENNVFNKAYEGRWDWHSLDYQALVDQWHVVVRSEDDAEGMVSVIEDEAQNLDILRRSAMQLSSAPGSFRVEESDARVQQWIGGIRGLRVVINSVEGRFKLSQDKQATDVQAAARHFAWVVGDRSSPERLLEFSGPSCLEDVLS